MAITFKVGDIAFLRIRLHPGVTGHTVLQRGCAGEVVEVREPDSTIKLRFHCAEDTEGRKYVRCAYAWL